MIRVLLSLVLVAAVHGQNAADLCASALLRGDQEAAAVAAASAQDPAQRARLQAALLPPSRRPAAMLAVAIRYPASVEADCALLAGAAAILALRDGNPLPELVAWNDLEDADDDFENYQPGAMIEALWRQVERRRKNGGDLGVLGEAEKLLHRCSVSRYGFEPVRVLPTADWQLPLRREPMQFRAWRRQPGLGSWSEITTSARPDYDVSLPVARTESLPTLPSGDWFVELASTRTRYRGFRLVEVSDLDVLALSDGERVALAAWQGRDPIKKAEWWLRKERVLPASGLMNGPTAVLSEQRLRAGGELFVVSNDQRARVALESRGQSYADAERWQVHVMVDRPIHRPGEKVTGRFLLRETTADGHGLDGVVRSQAAADQAYELRAFEGGAEVRLVGRTDKAGVGSFEIPVSETAKHGGVAMQLFVRGRKQPIYEGEPCSVVSFRRPAMFVEIVGATEAAGKEQATVAVQATWASGAPAANLVVSADLKIWTRQRGVISEEHQLQTGVTGLATLEIPLQKLAATWVRATFSVATPSGPKKLVHTIDARQKVATQKRWRPYGRSTAPELTVPATVFAGQSYEIGIHGEPWQQVMFVVGRGSRMRVHTLFLDERGNAKQSVKAHRDEWPALDVAVASAKNWDSARVPMLLAPRLQPEIEVAKRAAPGAEVACRVATGLAGTVVTVAVVDERVFAIAHDRTSDPETALRPRVARPRWRLSASAAAMAPDEVLGSLLEDGRVPRSGFSGSVDGSSAGPAAGGAAPAGPGDIRNDFRATATFVTVVAGADGVASVPIKLPDDLTTWRITVAGVATDGDGFLERRELVTEVPLAAEPVLPRVLRVGDTVEVAVAVDRKAGTAGGSAVRLTAACTEKTASIDRSELELTVAEGAAASAKVKVQGVASGVAQLALSVSVGEHEDRSVRPLTVQPDAVLRPVSRAGMGRGKVTVQAPADMTPDGEVEVRILGGSSAAWAEIERRLQTYPYGCVEQTLAKLLPYFAAVRGAKVHDVEPPVAGEDFTRRLRAGMRRMRRLQDGRGGAFAFWPGGEVDLDMTVLVLHGLAVLREGGHEPERFGLLCDPRREPFAGAIARLQQREGAAGKQPELLEVELAAACLRLRPETRAAKAAVLAAVHREQPLPHGLLLRAGLALVAAGDKQAAERCLDRARQPREQVAGTGMPGQDPLAIAALQLELQWAVDAGADHAELASEVLIGCLDGYSTTYAQACALSALALALPRIGSTDFPVEVRAGGKPKIVSLDPDNGFSARLTLPYTETCSVVGPDMQQLLVQVAGHKREPGSRHEGWQGNLTVARELCRRIEHKQKGRIKYSYVPIAAGQLRVGESVWLRMRVQASRPERYVVVDCPLPAGFEPLEELRWIERFDDRIAVCCSYVGQRGREFVVPLVPTMIGRMAWPPTTATPMYANGRDAGTAGSVVAVASAAAHGHLPTTIACCQKLPTREPRQPRPPSAGDQLDKVMGDLRGILEDADYDDLPGIAYRKVLAEQIERATKAIATRGNSFEAWLHVLDELSDTIDTCRSEVEDTAARAERTQARTAVLLQLLEKQYVCVVDTLARMAAEPQGEWDRHDVRTIIEALVMWPDRYEREERLAEVLQLAIGNEELPYDALDDITGPVECEQLRSVLLTMFAADVSRFGDELVRLLPREELAGVTPSALLEAAAEDWPQWLVATLLETSVGRAELQRLVTDPDGVRGHGEELLRAVPASYWRDAPLAVFAEISDAEVEGIASAELLALSGIPTRALQRELQRTKDDVWQATLVAALLARGERDLGAAAVDEDVFVTRWRQAVQLEATDATGALQLYEKVVEDRGGEQLCRFLLQIAVHAGTVEQLAGIVEQLDEDQVAAMFARLGKVERRGLLDLLEVPVYSLPLPQDDQDCAALWRYAERVADHGDVLATMCRTEIGLQFARRTVAAIKDDVRRGELLEELLTLQGLDEYTGRAPTGAPWQPLLIAVKHRGMPSTWTVAERLEYDRLRLLRGVR